MNAMPDNVSEEVLASYLSTLTAFATGIMPTVGGRHDPVEATDEDGGTPKSMAAVSSLADCSPLLREQFELTIVAALGAIERLADRVTPLPRSEVILFGKKVGYDQ